MNHAVSFIWLTQYFLLSLGGSPTDISGLHSLLCSAAHGNGNISNIFYDFYTLFHFKHLQIKNYYDQNNYWTVFLFRKLFLPY